MKVFWKVYSNVEKTIGQCIYIILTVIVFMQTVLRYFFHNSLPWPEEISSYLLVWLVYFTAGYATQKDEHMRIDSVVKIWPKRIVKYVQFVGNLVWLALGIYLTYYGMLYTMNQYQLASRASTVSWLKMWVIYLGIPLGHFFMSLRVIEKMIGQIKEFMGKGGQKQ